jgi:hypothetical protein
MFLVKYAYMAGDNYAGGVGTATKTFEDFQRALEFAVEHDGMYGVNASVTEFEEVFTVEGEELEWHLNVIKRSNNMGADI